MTGGHRSIGVINGDHPIGVASANQKWQWDICGQSMEISSYLNLSIYPIANHQISRLPPAGLCLRNFPPVEAQEATHADVSHHVAW